MARGSDRLSKDFSKMMFIQGGNRDLPSEKKERYCSDLNSKGVNHHRFCCGRNSKADRGVGKLCNGKKRRFQ